MLNYRLRQIICLLWNGNYIFIFFLYNFLYKYCVIYKLCNYKSHIELSFSSILLFIERPAHFRWDIPLIFLDHNFKDKSGREKGKKTRKRKEGKRDIRWSFIRKEKLPGAEASWDGWQEVGQGTTCTREEAKRRTETNEEKKRKKEDGVWGGRVCHGQCSQNVG